MAIRRRQFLVLWVAMLLFLAPTAPNQGRSQQADPWETKVDTLVLQAARAGEETEFLVMLQSQADLSPAANLAGKQAKGNYVYETLKAHAARTQAPLLAAIQRLRLPHMGYWIVNTIWVRGDLESIQQFALRPDVARLYANPQVQFAAPEPSLPELGTSQLPAAPATIEWNLLKINADDVWASGTTGQGVVIGGQDTGYQWDHPALINQYRGWNGASADHDYNWHDAIHSNAGFNRCGFDAVAPCDDHGHGTHTMGIMVGDDGGSNQVGVAPGARWIGCRNMDNGVGTPQTYIECYQWFVAPTQINGSTGDPTQAPDVINNSWACPVSEGCSEPDILLAAVQNVRAAGILTVQSAGNSGPSCSTVNTPAAIYDESFTVGNTTSTDTIASSSSRGPVLVDGSGRMKPDISAPGTSIRSAYPTYPSPTNTYTYLSGTSMAAPHVAGLAALLIAAHPELAGQVDQLETIITNTALPLTSTENCGGIPGSQVPNNTFGWGRIDALAAYLGAIPVDRQQTYLPILHFNASTGGIR